METLAQQIVYTAIDEVNLDQDDVALHIAKSPDALLFARNSSVDSLTLVRLFLTVERIIEEKAAKEIVLVDESAFEEEQSPFATIGGLVNHVDKILAA
jgi:serine/threonine protein kinase HipA of HipAB toxin-antitoxin module